ncbi:hypothetical protein J6590_017984 [Homalodisca vitripennis]|nr:hypothetical protein J6590_017984 [Homalodisca vitripennis]
MISCRPTHPVTVQAQAWCGVSDIRCQKGKRSQRQRRTRVSRAKPKNRSDDKLITSFSGLINPSVETNSDCDWTARPCGNSSSSQSIKPKITRRGAAGHLLVILTDTNTLLSPDIIIPRKPRCTAIPRRAAP